SPASGLSLGRAGPGGLGLRLGGGLGGLGCLLLRLLGGLRLFGLLGLLRLALGGDRLRRRLALGLLERLVEPVELGGLGLGDLQRTVGALDALELLPITGHLEQLLDGLGGLGAHAQPVLGTLGVDLDE